MGPGPDGVQPSARWPASARPTRWSCSAARSSRSAPGAACSPRSCAGRRCRTSSPPAGTCTCRCWISSRGNAFAERGRCLRRPGWQLRRRPARARARDDRVRDPDDQRVHPVPAVLVRARPDLLGGREPRRAGPGTGRSRRPRHPPREPARRARRQPLPLPGRRLAAGLDGIERRLTPPPPHRRRSLRLGGPMLPPSRWASRSTRSTRTPLYREPVRGRLRRLLPDDEARGGEPPRRAPATAPTTPTTHPPPGRCASTSSSTDDGRELGRAPARRAVQLPGRADPRAGRRHPRLRPRMARRHPRDSSPAVRRGAVRRPHPWLPVPALHGVRRVEDLRSYQAHPVHQKFLAWVIDSNMHPARLRLLPRPKTQCLLPKE